MEKLKTQIKIYNNGRKGSIFFIIWLKDEPMKQPPIQLYKELKTAEQNLLKLKDKELYKIHKIKKGTDGFYVDCFNAGEVK